MHWWAYEVLDRMFWFILPSEVCPAPHVGADCPVEAANVRALLPGIPTRGATTVILHGLVIPMFVVLRCGDSRQTHENIIHLSTVPLLNTFNTHGLCSKLWTPVGYRLYYGT